MAGVARRNIAKVKYRYPSRPTTAVLEGNAAARLFPEGKLVLFLYHAFGQEVLAEIIKKLEVSVSSGDRHIFLVYCNPVHGNLLDTSNMFTRWYAETLPYDESETGFGKEVNVVIWQSSKAATITPHAEPDRPIVVKTPLWAELAPKHFVRTASVPLVG